MSLEKRVAIVTGAGRGIGRATVLRLVSRGANVVAASRTAAELDETVFLTSGLPGRCVSHVADVTRPAEVQGLIDRAVREFGRLDILVNNAGLAPVSPIEKMDDAVFTDMIATNVHAVFFACRAAWSHLRSSRGVVVNLSSVAAFDPFPGFTAYGASKAWVNAFTAALANEGREQGVRVFAVAPGAVETSMLRQAFPKFPADRTLDPDDVAAMIEWLLDERCRYSSGQTVVIRR